MLVDAGARHGARSPVVGATEGDPEPDSWYAVAAVLAPLAAAGVSACWVLLSLMAGIFDDVFVPGVVAFGFAAVAFGACAVVGATRLWPQAGWLSPLALLSTVAGTSAAAGQHTPYTWGLTSAAAASAAASAAILVRSVTSAASSQRGWSPAALALGVTAASLVALLNPTPRPLPGDADHARVFVRAYQRDLDEALTEASTAQLFGKTEDGLSPLPPSLCHIAARCEVQLQHFPAGDLLFVPTYINWRNEYAGGLIRWTADGPPPVVEAFTENVTPIQNVGNDWWWSEPR